MLGAMLRTSVKIGILVLARARVLRVFLICIGREVPRVALGTEKAETI